MYKHKLTRLKNGLLLVTTPMPQVESLTVFIGVGAGSRHESKRVNGLFHFMEHMAFKGTKKRPSTLDIASEVDAVGGEFNAVTGKEITGYYIRAAAKHKELAFDILSDMSTNSLFKERDIEREKGVIIEEINMYEDTPVIRVQNLFARLLYGDNPMGWKTAGEKKSIGKIKRSDFLDYLERLYFPKNMVVAVAGKLNEKEIKELTKIYLGHFKRSGQKRTKAIKIKQEKSRVRLLTKKTEQAHFCLGFPGFRYSHPDRFAISVLAGILGGGMSSRMWIEVRERRGLAYYVRTEPDFYTDSGFIFTQVGVDLGKIEEAIKVVLAEYRKIVSQKITQKELKKTKEMLKGRFILSLEDSKNMASRYAGQVLLEKKIRTPKETMKLIDKVTPNDIQRVAKDVFSPKKLNLAIIGPYKSETRFKELLAV